MIQPELGKYIAQQRASRRLTQQELADTCNLNIRSIQRIEAGEVIPRMYTLNLLIKSLKMDMNNITITSNETKVLLRPMRAAYIGGIVFTINAVPVVYDLITARFDTLFHIFTTLVHMVSCVFFMNGFYQIGRSYKNWTLAVSALLMMIFLPAINILDLLKHYFFSMGEYLLFILMGINMIVMGAGLIKESLERKGLENGQIYKTAGIITILVSVLYLSLNTGFIHAGLILSFPGNLLLVYILYRELNKGTA
ncbi:helix-turn-helix domain-containing protein [Mucilaginibacter sp. HMF5004]|uniref:helix-turn-helix domain-containing protein n=1 Tax=Mucilaginibacter rivuli TaxID=2857527 RepID=UPI001C601271|nr:helix-turn-helix transcriptional regulator [Mucilaginibacter rivuli]MBW4890959.1 helix-turn-helix domain-containing protein [Mucilaginibacter rivuli]